MIGIGDYIMYWQNVTDNSLWDLTWQIIRHSTKQAHMQGFTMESVYWCHTGWKNVIIYTWNKDKIRHRQKSFKTNTKCIISHYRMSDMPPYEACNLCIDS